jgi:hypothetical protein
MNFAEFVDRLEQFIYCPEVCAFSDLDCQFERWSNVISGIEYYIEITRCDLPDFEIFLVCEWLYFTKWSAEYRDPESFHVTNLLKLASFYASIKDKFVEECVKQFFEKKMDSADIVYLNCHELFDDVFDSPLHISRISIPSLPFYFFAPRDYFVYCDFDLENETRCFDFNDLLPISLTQHFPDLNFETIVSLFPD